MSYVKIADLVKTLARKTSEDKVFWVQTERPNVFQTSFPSYSVRIFDKLVMTNEDENQQRLDMIVQIINENGDVVEEVSDEDLKGIFPGPFTVMRNMFDIARRQAMGVEKAIEEIMQALAADDGVAGT